MHFQRWDCRDLPHTRHLMGTRKLGYERVCRGVSRLKSTEVQGDLEEEKVTVRGS